MTFDDHRSAQDKAWGIASDPSASEKQWMAACCLLDEGQLSKLNRKKLPQAVGLPWSLAVSGLTGLGAFLIFGAMSATVFEAFASITGLYHQFSTPHTFALLSVAFIAFSWMFTYQQHIWEGGKAWNVLHYALVAGGAVLPFVNYMNPYQYLVFWSLGFVAVSILSRRLTQHSIKALDSSIGSSRVMPYSRAMFATAGAFLLLYATSAGTFVTALWLWWPTMLVCSGFYIARTNGAHNPRTAATLAFAVWNPIILANLILLPITAVYWFISLFVPSLLLPMDGYAMSLITIACFAIGPFVGSQIAASMQRRARELELHKSPADLALATQAGDFALAHTGDLARAQTAGSATEPHGEQSAQPTRRTCRLDAEEPLCETS